MRNISIKLFIVMTMMLTVACEKVAVSNHVGEKTVFITDIKLDSIVINADSTSLRGNFVLMDSSLMFVDQRYCKIFPYSVYTGKLSTPFGGFGQGPNEMNAIMYGASLAPTDSLMWIIDSSNGVYEFSPATGEINYLSRLDFSWNKKTYDYDEPSVYNIMEMSDFGVSIYDAGNDEVLIPLSFVNRNLNGVDAGRYDKGHILGCVNSRSLKVDRVIGSFPEFYKENPLPFFEFFDYAVNPKDSLIYVNHAPDSLIYCYHYPDKRLYTFGFEPAGINRKYTTGYDKAQEHFQKDISHVGVNTGLYFDPIDEILFRTSLANFNSGKVIMQAYKDNNLILECDMPPYFKLLGRIDDCYYGVRFLPVETVDEEVYFILYRFDRLPERN